MKGWSTSVLPSLICVSVGSVLFFHMFGGIPEQWRIYILEKSISIENYWREVGSQLNWISIRRVACLSGNSRDGRLADGIVCVNFPRKTALHWLVEKRPWCWETRSNNLYLVLLRVITLSRLVWILHTIFVEGAVKITFMFKFNMQVLVFMDTFFLFNVRRREIGVSSTCLYTKRF